jgi:hypothetical protein
MLLSDAELCELYLSYQDDPVAFMKDILRIDIVWAKMVEMAYSVRDNVRTAVFAGHAVSKSFTAAGLVLWFLSCFPPATVITTAPSNDQVENILWKDIRSLYAQAAANGHPLGGHLTLTKLDMGADSGVKWFAYGFATKPDTVTQEATRFQGYHNENVFLVFDEAAGIMPQIWKAGNHIMTTGHCRWLAIGNPTSAHGNFADLEQDPHWHFINIAVTDTPNFQEGREVIPGVSGREYEKTMRDKYGVESNEYKIRIKGQKPEYSEGTAYGKWLYDAAQSKRIGLFPHEPSVPVHTFWDIGDVHTAIWFVQFIAGEIRAIECYYDCKGQGLPHYAAELHRRDYVYGDHFAPPDIKGSNARSFQTGRTTLDVAKSLNINFKTVDVHRIEDEVEAVRSILPKCRFNYETCKEGIEALENFRKKKNEQLSTDSKTVYHKEYIHDWTSHIARSFGVMAMAYKYDKIGGKRLGVVSASASDIPVQPKFNPLAYRTKHFGRV